MNKVFAHLVVFLLMAGCGYMPSSHYAKKVLGDSVYVDIQMYAQEPENTVIIKDAILQALISRFRVSITQESQAQTTLKVSTNELRFTPIEYDQNGFVVANRAHITLHIKQIKAKKEQSFTVSGVYDFSIEPNGVVSDTQRFTAIKEASLRAIDVFITKLSIQGVTQE